MCACPLPLQVLHGILSEDQHASDGLPARAHALLRDFVSSESWRLLSHRLLSLMEDEELLQVSKWKLPYDSIPLS